MNVNRRKFTAGLGAGAAALALPGWLQARPETTLKLILSVPPGAALDSSARLLAEKLKTSLNRQVIVEYKVGGAGLSAGDYIKSGEADGDNLLYSPTGFYCYNPFLYSKLPYDPEKELAPVCEGGKTSFGFFVKAGTPRPLVDQYAMAITEALHVPEIEKRLNQIGLEVAGGTPEEFHKTLLDDRKRWEPIAKQAGIKLD